MNNKRTGDAGGRIAGIIKIIGIGQSLRGDDGAGLEAVRLWQATYQSKRPRPNVQVELIELPGIGLLSMLEGVRVGILVDAVQSGCAPGTIHQVSENEIAKFTQGSGSAHGWGVAESISLGRQIMPSTMPEKLYIIGIEISQMYFGETLSVEVRAALPAAAQLIEQYVVSVTTEPGD